MSLFKRPYSFSKLIFLIQKEGMNMKNEITEIIFILDRSGSMEGLEKDTIGGFNSFIQSQKQKSGDAYLTTILFDDEIQLLHNHVHLKKVKPLTSKQYYARGMTALLDAVGFGIHKGIEYQKKAPRFKKADHVIVVISTDGYENASHEYNYNQIHKMIQYEKERYHWEFLFLGARIDAIKEASKLGIHKDRAVRFYEDSDGVDVSFQAINSFATRVRESVFYESEDEWKKEVEKDYLKRRSY